MKVLNNSYLNYKSSNFKLSIALFFLAFLQFSNTLNHDFVLDDKIVLTENPRVQKGLAGIPNLFLKYNSQDKSDKYGYRPIVLTSLAIEHSFFKLNPKPYHAMNVIYFAILCVVLFNVLRKLFFNYTLYFPLGVTILFLVHPIHCEVVANIKSRDEIFSLLFSLLSILFLIKYYTSNNIKHLLLIILFFIFSFLSKESAITTLLIFPLIILYLNQWKVSKKLVITSVTSIALIIVSLLIFKAYTSSTLGADASTNGGTYYVSNLFGNSFSETYFFTDKLANAFILLFMYLKNFLVPTNLVYYYGYNQIPLASWSNAAVMFSVVFHLALLGLAIFSLKKMPIITLSILFYFITISFYLHIILPLADTMADRFLFTSSLALCILMVLALDKVLKIKLIQAVDKGEQKLNLLNLKGITLLVILSFYSFKTYSRNKAWKDSYTLFKTDMPYLQNCSRAHFFYANALRTKMKKLHDLSLEQQMIIHYNKSIQISDSANFSYLGLATYYCDLNRFKEGIPLLEKEVAIYYTNYDVHYYLGKALFQIDSIDRASYHLQQSINLNGNFTKAYYYLAYCYSKNKEFDKAVHILKNAEKTGELSSDLYTAYSKVYFEKDAQNFQIELQNNQASKNRNTKSEYLKESTAFALKSLLFGADPEMVYGSIIGHYQILKDTANSNYYYKIAINKGIKFRY